MTQQYAGAVGGQALDYSVMDTNIKVLDFLIWYWFFDKVILDDWFEEPSRGSTRLVSWMNISFQDT